MTIDTETELARIIQALSKMVRADGMQSFSSKNGMEWSTLCGLKLGRNDDGLTVSKAHNLDLRIQAIKQVNDNNGTDRPMLSVDFHRGNPSVLSAWHSELVQFYRATFRTAS